MTRKRSALLQVVARWACHLCFRYITLEYHTGIHYLQIMPLTSSSSLDSESFVSQALQLSPTPSAIGTPGHSTRNSSSSGSDSSSRTVMPMTTPYPQANLPAVQGTLSAKRNRDSQQRKKLRSKITGLATPFHIDTLHRPQGVLPHLRLSSRKRKGKVREHQRIKSVDKVGNKSVIVRLTYLLTNTIPPRVMPDMLLASVVLSVQMY